jgi:thiamine-monophosphate kinase
MSKTVADLGEFGLIERLARIIGTPEGERVVVGIGDDAAVWRSASGYTIATTDTMVAGVHFLPGLVPWREVGWKALAANISDIAAMGGTPTFALVTLCTPPALDAAAVEDVYRGMREIAEVYGVTVIGGDVVRSKTLTITIALLGDAEFHESDGAPKLLLRNAARPGDTIAVTGHLGGAAGGLRLLMKRSARPRTETEAQLVERHIHPWPRVDAGGAAIAAGIECGMDISDGLLQDLAHICRASGVDAEVRLADIPLEPGLTDVFGEEALLLALAGGEDYELLLTGGERLHLAHRVLQEQLGVDSLWEIGRVTGVGKGRVRVVDARGKTVRVAAGGFDHLRKATR